MACFRLRREQGEVGKVSAQVAAVLGGEAVGLDQGVGRDQEVGGQILARSALCAVAPEAGPRVSSSHCSEVLPSFPRAQPMSARMACSSNTGTATR